MSIKDTMVGGLLTIGGGLVVVAATGYLQRDMAQIEFAQRARTEAINRRLEAYKDMVTVLADGRRFQAHRNLSGSDVTQLSLIMGCAEANRDPSKSDPCTFNMKDKDTRELVTEVYAASSKFETAKAMADVFFCDATKYALTKMPKGQWWWNATGPAHAELLATMKGELLCGLGTTKQLGPVERGLSPADAGVAQQETARAANPK